MNWKLASPLIDSPTKSKCHEYMNMGCCSTRVIVVFYFYTFTISLLSSSIFVCAAEAFDSLLNLPQSGFSRSKSKRVIFFGDFGAKGNGFSDDTKALKHAWEIACSSTGRTRLEIPAGYTFLIHPINFYGPCRSKVTLRISGTIAAPEDPSAWDNLNPRKWLYFHRVNHLTVEGNGLIDGNGREWWDRSCKINETNAVTFHRCKNLKVKNLMVVNSQQMHVAFTNCLRVDASNLRVIAPSYSPNTDGIHISASRVVRLKDNVVRTGDDCISIVNNSSRIWISNIVCGPGHDISIGSLGKSNSRSHVHDVLVDGALLSNTENGVRIKTWQGGSGFAANISFQHILMDNVSNPIIVDQYYCDSLTPCANQTLAVKVENISFAHIKGTSATEEVIRFACSDDSPCEQLYLEDIQLVSSSGEMSKSFCWQAHGFSQGLVHPSPCFSRSESLFEHTILPNLATSSGIAAF